MAMAASRPHDGRSFGPEDFPKAEASLFGRNVRRGMESELAGFVFGG
jgi:hypothetical protein